MNVRTLRCDSYWREENRPDNRILGGEAHISLLSSWWDVVPRLVEYRGKKCVSHCVLHSTPLSTLGTIKFISQRVIHLLPIAYGRVEVVMSQLKWCPMLKYEETTQDVSCGGKDSTMRVFRWNHSIA